MAFKEYLSTGRSNFSAFNDMTGPDSSYTTSPTPNYVRNMPTFNFKEEINNARAAESGTLLDFLGSTVTGGLEGLTFGALRLGKDPEDMNMAERMGSGFGNVLSMVAPIGPFMNLARAGNWAVRGLSAGSRALGQKAASTVAQKMAGKGLSKEYLETTVKKELADNDSVSQLVTRHGISDEEMEIANKLLTNNLAAGLKTSFTNAGKNVSDDVVREISEKVANELRKPGRHINTIEDWVESAIQTKLPKFMSGAPSQYLGMAAQDAFVFFAHSAIQKTVGKIGHGDQYTGEQLWNEALFNLGQSAAFPLVRAIPNAFGDGAGKTTLMQGFKMFKNKLTLNKGLSESNYGAMIKTKEGQKNARGLLHMLTKGADNNAQNISLFGGRNYSVKSRTGKTVTEYGPDKILTEIDDMPIQHVKQILEQYQKITSDAFGKWGKAYLKDLAGSIPRMAVGSMVMNIDMFKNGYYDKMRTPELFQHMVVGGFMTKSRGLWGRGEVSQWTKDFNKYNEVFNYLNMDATKLTDLVDIHTNNRLIGEMHELTTLQTKSGRAIYDIVDPGNKDANSHISNTEENYSALDQNIVNTVEEAVRLANMMHMPNVPTPYEYDPINVKALSKERILEIYEGLSQVKVGDMTLTDMPFGDFVSTTMIELGQNNKTYYLRMLDDIAKQTGISINVETNKETGEYTGKVFYDKFILDGTVDYSVGGQHQHSVNKLAELLLILEDMGIAQSYANTNTATRFVVKGKGKDAKVVRDDDPEAIDVGKIIDNAAERYMGQIIRNVHGGNESHRIDNFFGLNGNPYLDYIRIGRNEEIKDQAYRLANGDVTGDPNKAEAEQNFIAMAEMMFKINNKYTKDFIGRLEAIKGMIRNAPIVVADDFAKHENLDGPKKDEADADIANIQAELSDIFGWVKAAHSGDFAPSDVVNEIPLSEARIMVQAVKDMGFITPSDGQYKWGFHTELADYVAKRAMRGMKFKEEDLAIVIAARENGLFSMEDKTILSAKALRQALKRAGHDDVTIGNTLKKYNYILDRIGRNKSVQLTDDIPLLDDSPLTSPDAIDEVYSITKKGSAEVIKKELLKLDEMLGNGKKLQEIRDLGLIIQQIIMDFKTVGQIGINQGRPGAGSEEATATLNEQVQAVIRKIKAKVTNNPMMDVAIRNLETHLQNIELMYQEGKWMELYDSDHIAGIGESIEAIIKGEEIWNMQINENIAKISALANSPLRGGQLIKLKDILMDKIAEGLNRDDISSLSLEEAIKEYAKSRSLYDLNEILYKVNLIAATTKNIDTYSRDNDEAKSYLEDIIRKNASHADNDSPIKVLKRFNLTHPEDPNKVDPDLVEMAVDYITAPTLSEQRKYVIDNFSQDQKNRILANGGFRPTDAETQFIIEAIQTPKRDLLLRHITERISEKFAGEADAVSKTNRAYADFVEQFPVIVKHIAAGDELNTVFTIGENTVEVDPTIPGRRTLGGLNSELIKSLNLEGIGQLNENIIINGRKTNIYNENLTKDDLVKLLNENDHVTKDLINKIRTAEDPEEVVYDNIENRYEGAQFTILDMNDGAPIVVPLTPRNIESITNFFEIWRNNKLQRLTDADARNNFEFATEQLMSKRGSSVIEVKMTLMNMDIISSGDFDAIFASKNFKQQSRENLDQLMSKILKKSKQAVNKNYTYIQNNHLDLIIRTPGMDADVVRGALKFKDAPVKILVISDENYQKQVDEGNYAWKDKASNRDSIIDYYDSIINDPNQNATKRRAAQLNKDKLLADKTIESTLSSTIDGNVLIIDHDFTVINGAFLGNKDGNGFKNNISYNSGFGGTESQGILTKGYFHENPLISNNPDINLGGVTLVMGESSAKALYGIENNVEITPFQLDPNKTIMENLKDIAVDNTEGVIDVPFSSIGIGHMAKPGDKVMISNSLADNMNPTRQMEIRVFQALAQKVEQLSYAKQNWEKLENTDQALILMQEIVADSGYDFTDGGFSLAEIMLKSGVMSHHNPIIREAVNSLFRGKVFDTIRRNMTEKGADTYLTPDYENNHAAPLFIELENYRPSDLNTVVDISRIVYNFGEMSAPHHLGQKRISTVEDIDFIFEFEGRDIRFRYNEDGTLDVTDHMADIVNDNRYLTRFDGNDASITSLDNNMLNTLKGFGEIIRTIINSEKIDQSTLTNEGILSILQSGGYFKKDNNNNRTWTRIDDSSFKKILKKYRIKGDLKSFVEANNIGIGMVSIAIPKKSFDVGFNRVKGFLSKEFGNHSIINNHDLRVMHQRDFDGDHGYHFYGMPSKVIDNYIKRMGIIEDYAQYDRKPYKSNPLGLDQKGNIGAVPTDVGFTSLKSSKASTRFAIGETISIKNVLNWASNIGIEFNFEGNKKVEFLNLSEIDGIQKGILSPEGIAARTNANINQNAVDFTEPTAVTKFLKELLLFGDVPPEVAKEMQLQGHTFEGSLTDPGRFKVREADGSIRTENQLNQEIALILINTLKKSSAIFTDPFNEGGQFTPTDWYLGNVYQNLTNMLRNPNQYVLNQLVRKYSGDNDMLQAIITKFYKGSREADMLLDNDKIKKFLFSKGGDLPTPTIKFITFKNAGKRTQEFDPILKKKTKMGYNDVNNAIEMDNSGFALKTIYEKQLLKDKDYYGGLLDSNRPLTLDQIISKTNGLVNRVMLYKAYYGGNEPVTKMFEDGQEGVDLFEVELPGKNKRNKPISFHNIEMRSAAYHILNKEASSLRIELAKMEGAPYKTNSYDEKVLKDRLADVESTLKVLDKLALKNLVDKNMFIQSSTHRFKTGQSLPANQKMHVYSIKGTVEQADLQKQDFSQFDYVGQVNKGQTYKRIKGRTYIEVKSPLIRRYVGDNDSIHSLALYQSIYKVLDVNNISRDPDKIDMLYERTYEVIHKINDDYSFARRNAAENKAYKRESYSFAAEQDMAILEQYFKEFGAIDEAGNLRFEDGEPGVDLVLQLIKPRPVSGAYVATEKRDVPFVYSNPRLIQTVMKFLSEKGVIEIVGGETIMPDKLQAVFKAQRHRVSELRGFKHEDSYLDYLVDHHKSAMSVSLRDFEVIGKEGANIVTSLLADYGFIDPAIANLMEPENFDGTVYNKKDIHGKKIKFKSSRKQKVNGCIQ